MTTSLGLAPRSSATAAAAVGCSRSADPRGYLLYLGFERNFNNQLRHRRCAAHRAHPVYVIDKKRLASPA